MATVFVKIFGAAGCGIAACAGTRGGAAPGAGCGSRLGAVAGDAVTRLLSNGFAESANGATTSAAIVAAGRGNSAGTDGAAITVGGGFWRATSGNGIGATGTCIGDPSPASLSSADTDTGTSDSLSTVNGWVGGELKCSVSVVDISDDGVTSTISVCTLESSSGLRVAHHAPTARAAAARMPKTRFTCARVKPSTPPRGGSRGAAGAEIPAMCWRASVTTLPTMPSAAAMMRA